MTDEEMTTIRAFAERAHIGDEVVCTVNGSPMIGVVRWLTGNEICFDLGMPRKWRELLNFPEPSGTNQLRVRWR